MKILNMGRYYIVPFKGGFQGDQKGIWFPLEQFGRYGAVTGEKVRPGNDILIERVDK